MIRLEGVLLTVFNEPRRFESIFFEKILDVKAFKKRILCDRDGNYSSVIKNGTYKVYTQELNGRKLLYHGDVVITSETQSPLPLETLLVNYKRS